MGIDNNQLVARYFDRKADHAAFFKALEAYLDDQINELYTTLNDTFADTVTLSLDVAIAKAHQAGAKIDDLAAEEIAATNYLFKELSSRGLWLQSPDQTEPNTIIAKLNFGNRRTYY